MDEEEWFWYKQYSKERYKTCQGEKPMEIKKEKVKNNILKDLLLKLDEALFRRRILK